MKIYISLVTNKKTGIREVGQVTYTKKTAWIFSEDVKNSSKHFNFSHTEEWEDREDSNLYEKKKEYVTEEDWGIK